MKVQDYWLSIVKPLMVRFNNEPTAIELAFAACISLNQVKDYLPLIIKKNERELWLLNENEKFKLVIAIAEAAKHVVADHRHHGEYRWLKADSAKIGKGAAFDDGTFWDDGTSWSDSPEVVRISTPDGTIVDMSWLLNDVASKIEQRLKSLQ